MRVSRTIPDALDIEILKQLNNRRIPSVREIARSLGISFATVQNRIDDMAEDRSDNVQMGYLEKGERGQARAVLLTKRGHELLRLADGITIGKPGVNGANH